MNYKHTIFLTFLTVSTLHADFKERLQTIMDALLYPITRHLPESELEEENPVAPFAEAERIQKELASSSLRSRPLGKHYVNLLKTGGSKTPGGILGLHHELRRTLLETGDREAISQALESAETLPEDRYQIQWDLARTLLVKNPEDEQGLEFLALLKKLPATEASLDSLRARASALIFEGEPQKALKILKPLQTEKPDAEYLQAQLFSAMDDGATTSAMNLLPQLASHFPENLLLQWKAMLQYQSADFYGLIQTYESHPNLEIPAEEILISYLMTGSGRQALKTAKRNDLHALVEDFPANWEKSPATGKIFGLGLLSPEIQERALKELRVSPAELKNLLPLLAEGPIRTTLEQRLEKVEIRRPPPGMHPALFALEPLLQIQGPINRLEEVLKDAVKRLKNAQISEEDQVRFLMELPILEGHEARERALAFIGSTLPDSREMLARLMQGKPQEKEPEFARLPENPTDSDYRARAIWLFEQSRIQEAYSLLSRMNQPEKSWLWHLARLQSLLRTEKTEEAFEAAHNTLEVFPEAATHPAIAQALFQGGDFTGAIIDNPSEDLPSGDWEIQILARVFAFEIPAAMDLFRQRSLEIDWPEIELEETPVSYVLLQNALLSVLTPMAQEAYFQQLGEFLNSDQIRELLNNPSISRGSPLAKTLKELLKTKPPVQDPLTSFAQGNFTQAILENPSLDLSPEEWEIQILARIFAYRTQEALELFQKRSLDMQWPQLEWNGEMMQKVLFQIALLPSLGQEARKRWLSSLEEMLSTEDAGYLLDIDSVRTQPELEAALKTIIQKKK